MPHHLHRVSARVRLAFEMTPTARAAAALAGVALVVAGGGVPLAALALAPDGAGGAVVVPSLTLAAVAGGSLGWLGSLLVWAAASGGGRLTVADENFVVRHQPWLRGPLVIYRSQIDSVVLGEPRRARGLANVLRPARPNLTMTFNEPKRIDALRPLAWLVVAGRRSPRGLSFRVPDVQAARAAFDHWIRPGGGCPAG